MKYFCLASLFVLVSATSAFAQLRLEIKDGLVSIDARSVPARQILSEWARIGGTRVVGSEKITGAPLTLKFTNLPERQALDIILRNVAGYMAAPRQASAAPGASGYDRILILATTSAPAVAATPTRGNANTNTRMNGRPMPPRPPNMQPPPDVDTAEPEPQLVEEQSDTGVQPPVFTFPQQQPANGGNQVFVPVGPNGTRPGGAPPVITLQPNANGQPTVYTFVPNGDQPPAAAPTGPTTPFGATGAPSPGMIQQPPPPAPGQPVPPGQPQRPPKE